MTIDIKKLEKQIPLEDSCVKEIDPGKRYLIFVDAQRVDVNALAELGDSINAVFVPVLRPSGGSVTDVISMFEINK